MRLLLATKEEQLVFGFALIVAGTIVMPLMASLVTTMAYKMNPLIFGKLFDWQRIGIRFGGYFFAAGCIVAAAYGATLLAAASAVRAGLISSSWE